ncbi:MAG: hypothetical protein GY715_15985 [Planctomycetes bacterium]|nr:hypothetical protein [Planctomycetota bacterium]
MTEPGVPIEDLVAYVSGELNDAEAADVERRLASRPEGAATTAALRSVLADLAANELEDAPPHVIERLIALNRRPLPEAVWKSWIDRATGILAQLVFDSRAQPAVAGFRASPTTVQLAYEWEDGRVDLQITPDSEGSEPRRIVRGQARRTPGSFGSAVLLDTADRTLVVATAIDDHGRFRLSSDTGRYDLVLELDDGRRAVTIGPLEIR